MIKNDLSLIEKELYDAWKAVHEVQSSLDGPEQDHIYERSRIAYERAYDELGPRWTQRIISTARRDAGE
jgi:hypothetical protein